MTKVMQGVRVVEVAQFMMAPSAGALLADWGADVLKIEHPLHGDGQRGFIRWNGLTFDPESNPIMEGPNRGKRSVGLDISRPEGRKVFDELIKGADVFLTNLLPDAREKLGIDIDAVRAANPDIIYVRASAFGDKGPHRNRGGFDGTVFFSHSGIAHAMTPRELEAPVMQGVGGFGDQIGGLALAGGIAGALFHRSQTGETTEIDVSLLSAAWWAAAASINATMISRSAEPPPAPSLGGAPGNPFMGQFRSSDGQIISLFIMQPGPFIRDTFEHLGLPELADDPRFSNAKALMENWEAADLQVAAAIARHPATYWRERLATMRGQWAAVQSFADLIEDEQALANDMLFEVETPSGGSLSLTRGPVQFNHAPVTTTRAPQAFEHTEMVLLELGMGWDDLEALKSTGIVA